MMFTDEKKNKNFLDFFTPEDAKSAESKMRMWGGEEVTSEEQEL